MANPSHERGQTSDHDHRRGYEVIGSTPRLGRRGWDRGKARGAFVRPDTWKSISVMDRAMESFKEILLEAKKEAARVAQGSRLGWPLWSLQLPLVVSQAANEPRGTIIPKRTGSFTGRRVSHTFPHSQSVKADLKPVEQTRLQIITPPSSDLPNRSMSINMQSQNSARFSRHREPGFFVEQVPGSEVCTYRLRSPRPVVPAAVSGCGERASGRPRPLASVKRKGLWFATAIMQSWRYLPFLPL